jgi:hypothetical protein
MTAVVWFDRRPFRRVVVLGRRVVRMFRFGIVLHQIVLSLLV